MILFSFFMVYMTKDLYVSDKNVLVTYDGDEVKT
jgi:hypothetical protein